MVTKLFYEGIDSQLFVFETSDYHNTRSDSLSAVVCSRFNYVGADQSTDLVPDKIHERSFRYAIIIFVDHRTKNF